VLSLEALTGRPRRRHDAVEDDGAAVAAGHPERQSLPDEPRVAVPDLPPVARHVRPLRVPGPPHGHGSDVPSAGDVEDEHGDPPPVPLHPEAHAAAPGAGRAAVLHGDDAGVEVGDEAKEHGLGQVEVPQRRVAPVLVGLGVVGRARVGRRHRHRSAAGRAGGAAVAPQLVAAPAGPALVEERHAQRRRFQPVALLEQVAVPARALCLYASTRNAIVLYYVQDRARRSLGRTHAHCASMSPVDSSYSRMVSAPVSSP
jgi:hypothetical protein